MISVSSPTVGERRFQPSFIWVVTKGVAVLVPLAILYLGGADGFSHPLFGWLLKDESASGDARGSFSHPLFG